MGILGKHEVNNNNNNNKIWQRDWLKLAGEKVGTVPTFLSVRANKFAKWKTGLSTA